MNQREIIFGIAFRIDQIINVPVIRKGFGEVSFEEASLIAAENWIKNDTIPDLYDNKLGVSELALAGLAEYKRWQEDWI